MGVGFLVGGVLSFFLSDLNLRIWNLYIPEFFQIVLWVIGLLSLVGIAIAYHYRNFKTHIISINHTKATGLLQQVLQDQEKISLEEPQ